MSLKRLLSALAQDLPVLFAYIGWATEYIGTEDVYGYGHLKSNPRDNAEARAFGKHNDGFFRCGIGPGAVDYARLHVVFVALEPSTQVMKIVGVYAAATIEMDGSWAFAATRNAALIAAR